MKQAATLLAMLVWSSLAGAEQRFAIAIGSDIGAPGRERLQFAQRDAERFAQTLTELGKFPEEHVRVIRGGSVSDVTTALDEFNAAMDTAKRAGDKSLLVFYFSGHGTQDGIELGREVISYATMRGWMAHSSASARIVVVDACGAGGLTKVKGARALPPPMRPLLPADQVEGEAYISSTAGEELAQESTEIQGSFFTLNFEAALRGAGDTDNDHQVTLAEAFQYSAQRTVNATIESPAGAQHPTFDWRLSGRSDIVLADLRRAEGTLVLPAAPGATYLVRGPGDFLSEFTGEKEPTRLGLPSGSYVIERRTSGSREIGRITLAHGQVATVAFTEFQPCHDCMKKGGPRPWDIFAAADFASNSLVHASRLGGGGLGVEIPIGRSLWDVRVRADFASGTVDESSLNYSLLPVDVWASALWPVIATHELEVRVGPGLGYVMSRQVFADGSTAWAGGATGGGVVTATYPVWRLRLGLEASAGAEVCNVDGSPQVGLLLRAGLTLGVPIR